MSWTDLTDDTQSWTDAVCWIVRGAVWNDNCLWLDASVWLDSAWPAAGDDTQTWSDA